MNFRRYECYKNAYLFASTNPGWIIAHGICIGTGRFNRGKKIGHAWNEKRELLGTLEGIAVFQTICHDPYSGVETIQELFYLAGQISLVKRYTLSEAYEKMRETKNYGPWHETIKRAGHKGKIV